MLVAEGVPPPVMRLPPTASMAVLELPPEKNDVPIDMSLDAFWYTLEFVIASEEDTTGKKPEVNGVVVATPPPPEVEVEYLFPWKSSKSFEFTVIFPLLNNVKVLVAFPMLAHVVELGKVLVPTPR